MLYERIYLEENYSIKAKDYIEKLNSRITKDSKIDYIIALHIQDEILKYQEKENNPFKLYKKAKRLARKYKSN